MATSAQIEKAAKWLAENMTRIKWDGLRRDGRAADPSSISPDGFPPWKVGSVANARQEDFRDIVRQIVEITSSQGADDESVQDMWRID